MKRKDVTPNLPSRLEFRCAPPFITKGSTALTDG